MRSYPHSMLRYPDLSQSFQWVDVPRNERPVVLKVENLTKTFPVQGKAIRRSKGTMTAVDRASFETVRRNPRTGW